MRANGVARSKSLPKLHLCHAARIRLAILHIVKPHLNLPCTSTQKRYSKKNSEIVRVCFKVLLMGSRESQSISNLGEVGGGDDRTSMSEALQLRDRALAATNNGIVIADARDPDFPIVYCNPSFERITGYCAREILGRNCRFLQGPDTDRATVANIRTALQEGREIQVTIKNYRKDGTGFWNKLCLSPVRDDSGNLTYFIGIQSDLSERLEVQEALQQANDRLQT
ncbi:MAG: PAS domain-containing protein, partial [Microcoleus sp.]